MEKSLFHVWSFLKYSVFAIVVTMLSSTWVSGQNPGTTFIPVAHETFPNAFVRCILKDSKGFVWLGTHNGLIRYDGTHSRIYEHNPEDKTSLCHNNINVIIEDHDQNLWIGTALGLSRYNRDKDTFTDVDWIPENTNHLSNTYITALSFDYHGRLWIGTHGGGINIYNLGTYAFTYHDDGIPGKLPPVSNYINSLLLVDSVMWTGTKGGLRLFNPSDTQPITAHVVDEKIPVKQVTQLVAGRSGNIWLATADGEVIELVPENGTHHIGRSFASQKLFPSTWSNILTMSIDKTGNLWVGGEDSGLNYINVTSNEIIRFLPDEGNSKMLPTSSIRAVYLDDAGIIWVGTFNKGAYLIDSRAKKFESYQRSSQGINQVANNEVRSFAEDKEGNIWIATEDGLCILNSGDYHFSTCEEINKGLSNRHITDLIFDKKGRLWIGTLGAGVFRFDGETRKLVNYRLQSQGFGDGKVACLYQDKMNVIWAGSYGSGLYFFDEKKNAFKVLANETKPDFITKTAYISSVLEDADSTIWVGSYFGLYALRRQSNQLYDYDCYRHSSEPGSISSSGVQALYEDRDGGLWVGTGDNGLNFLQRGSSRFEVWQKKDGLPGNSISGILQDANRNLWISGNMGLSKFNPRSKVFRNYTKDDGLMSNEFYLNACWSGRDGKLFFGGSNGFTAFFPDSIHANVTKPMVCLTDLKIGNQSAQIGVEDSPLKKHISVTRDIELNYNQRSFSIDFVAINYGQSSKNHYCYRLEEFEKAWNCNTSGNSATYTNIDPGRYTFVVKASNSDGIESGDAVRLNIIIHEAFWKTWWAIAAYTLILSCIAFFIMKISMERTKMKNQLFLEQLAREREHELSESKSQFFTNISHELRTPLSLILLPLESLLANEELSRVAKERLLTAYKSADKMASLVNELLDFNKLENGKLKLEMKHGELVDFIREVANTFRDLAEKGNINFEFLPMVSSLQGWFDRSKLEKILVNILSNAFKFTAEGGQISMVIMVVTGEAGEEKKQSRCLQLSIADNGIGIPSGELPYIFNKFYQAKSASKIANPGTGIGLALTKGLVELLHGKITATSKIQETKFEVIIPIDRHVFDETEIAETPLDLYAAHHGSQPNKLFDNSLSKASEKPRVLIVEDNAELREYLVEEFREEFNILEAKDGQEGMEIAIDKNPDLIISDILMPRKSGIELCSLIKKDLKTSHIPVILLTARTTIEDQIQGIENGADVYITKPFSLRFLLTHARRIIDSRQKLYSYFSNEVYLLPGKIATNEIDRVFLQSLIDHIIENIQNTQLGVDSIAEVFNLSRAQVYRKIKALSGKTAVEFIRIVRLKQALKLMEKRQYTLSEIAYQTGFNTASYFTRSFKEQYGKAPSEFLEKAATPITTLQKPSET